MNQAVQETWLRLISSALSGDGNAGFASDAACELSTRVLPEGSDAFKDLTLCNMPFLNLTLLVFQSKALAALARVRMLQRTAQLCEAELRIHSFKHWMSCRAWDGVVYRFIDLL